jgi:hypothetical protein
MKKLSLDSGKKIILKIKKMKIKILSNHYLLRQKLFRIKSSILVKHTYIIPGKIVVIFV